MAKVLSDTDSKLESPFLLELRLWHVALLSSGLGLALVSAICCLVRVRSEGGCEYFLVVNICNVQDTTDQVRDRS